MVERSGRDDVVHRVVDTVWRMESPRLIAALTRVVGDVGQAEDVAQDAMEAALRQWPADGVPDNPGAWLMATAKHRAIDIVRRRATLQRKAEEIGRDIEAEQLTPPDLAWSSSAVIRSWPSRPGSP
jgi:predicted RNA polymerase sigma factor